MNKISIQELTDIVAQQSKQTKKFSEQFLRELVDVISEYLQTEGMVKVKGLGTFKIITVEERKSVDVKSGNEIVLPAHNKVQFIPEDAVKQQVNAPYSHLQTTILDNPVPADFHKAKPVEPVAAPVAAPIVAPEPVSAPEPVATAAPVEEPVSAPEPVTVSEPVAAPEPEATVTPENAEEPVKPTEADSSKDGKDGVNGCFWLLPIFLLIIIVIALFFTRKTWIPLAKEYLHVNLEAIDDVDTPQIAEPEAVVVDSALLLQEDTLSYNDSIAVVEDSISMDSVQVEEPAAEVEPEPEKFDITTYTPKMAKEAPVREVVTVIDGSRLTMVAYRAYGEKIFWVYVYDANRDVLKSPSGVAKGMELKIADLPAELTDPESPEAIAFARELSKKYDK